VKQRRKWVENTTGSCSGLHHTKCLHHHLCCNTCMVCAVLTCLYAVNVDTALFQQEQGSCVQRRSTASGRGTARSPQERQQNCEQLKAKGFALMRGGEQVLHNNCPQGLELPCCSCTLAPCLTTICSVQVLQHTTGSPHSGRQSGQRSYVKAASTMQDHGIIIPQHSIHVNQAA